MPGSVATTAVVLPAFFIILLVMVLLMAVLDSPYAQAALRGVKPCIIGIILATSMEMILANCVPADVDLMALMLTMILFGSKCDLKKKLSPITLIRISACLGVAAYGV